MRIHFIAIGGSAMHNLALALQKRGDHISGSDDEIFEPSRSRLQKAGLLPAKTGWFPEKIDSGLDAVILGMHAKPDNPELQRAKELGVKIYSYPEFLYEASRDKIRVVIGGSHGKTTITSMILHVMAFHKIEVDYMVGAQLEGFDTMVRLSEKSRFIVIEGDEYLSSPIDRRPKFHLYKPDIALLSGIAWDHINVFPTYETYVKQFEIYIDKISDGGALVFNEEDEEVSRLVEKTEKPIQKYGYKIPAHRVKNGITYLETPGGGVALEIFGNHNLNNLEGARKVCELMGVGKTDFYKAIAGFKGAAKRMEVVFSDEETAVFKDYAHSPSKVKASVEAVRSQYPGRRLIACLELHTYSSLNPDFLDEYKNTMEAADTAVVFYSPKAVLLKRLEAIKIQQIETAFGRSDLVVFTNPADFKTYLFAGEFKNTNLLLMSSGNYGGLDFEELKSILKQ